MIKRVVAGLTAFAVAAIPTVASAAPPAFAMDVDLEARTLVVNVTFEPVPSGFTWEGMEASGVLDELVGVLPSNQVDDSGRPSGDTAPLLIPLERVSEGVYQGRAVVPHEGKWAVVAWPLEPDLNPPARTLIVAVGGDTPAVVWVGLGIVTAVLLVLLAGRSKRRAEQPMADSPV